MSSERKRMNQYETSKVVRKRPKPEESPEQEISVHPYEDDFFGSDNELNLETDCMETEHSPNITLEPGVNMTIDSPAFPLSKASRETNKHGRRRYRDRDTSSTEPAQLVKDITSPVRDSKRIIEKDHHSRSHSRSPFPSGHKGRVIRRNASSGKNSPVPADFEQESRHSEQRKGGREYDRPRSKHSREQKSRHFDSRETESRGSGRDVRISSEHHSRERSDHHRLQESIDSTSRTHRKDRPRNVREQHDHGVPKYKRHSSPHRDGRERHSRYRETHEKSSRESSQKSRHNYHKSQTTEKEGSQKVPEVVVVSDSSGGVELVEERIEDLIKEIQESSTGSDSDEQEETGGAVKESQLKSPESVSSKSFSSPEVNRQSSGREGEPPDTVKPPDIHTQSDSEGEIQSPEATANPYVMRSRFDSSDHSEYSDDEPSQAESQKGIPHYDDDAMVDEDSGGSPVNSPQSQEPTNVDLPCPHESPESPPAPILPPYLPALMGCKSVESYEWLDRIEEGTYGVVYKAKDKRTGDIVALKKLKMEKEKEGFPITSLREINMLLKAAHPNIVPVREIVVGSSMDKIYIVMDFIKHDLKALMSTMKEKFLEGEVKTLLLHLLRAVHHMHDNWILHRDLKTSNLLLSHNNILKVADFGLAREYGSPLLNYTPVVVTLWYRCPELLLGAKEYSTAVDVWSVGCIFAELLLHKPLFTGRSEIDQLNKIFTELGTPNEKIWPGFKQLSGAKNVTFTHHPQGNLRKKNPSLTTKSGFDLLFKLLTYDPKKRISAKDALDHTYFKDLPRPVPPEMFPTWPTKSEIAKNKQKREKSPTPPEGGAFVLKGAEELSPGPGFSLKF